MPKKLKEEFIKEISIFVENFNEDHSFFETLKVFVNKEIEDIKFNKVYLAKLNKEKIQTISLVLGQSVALEKYEIEIEERISELEKVITILKSGIWRGLNEKNIISNW